MAQVNDIGLKRGFCDITMKRGTDMDTAVRAAKRRFVQEGAAKDKLQTLQKRVSYVNQVKADTEEQLACALERVQETEMASQEDPPEAGTLLAAEGKGSSKDSLGLQPDAKPTGF